MFCPESALVSIIKFIYIEKSGIITKFKGKHKKKVLINQLIFKYTSLIFEIKVLLYEEK